MDLLSGEVPAGPETRTSSSQIPDQQRKISKGPSEEKILKFKKAFFRFHLLIGFTGWAIVILYFLSPFFTGSFLPPTCPNLSRDLKNLYEQKFSFDLHAFISENETNFDSKSELIWRMPKLTYGDLQSTFSLNLNVSISEMGRLMIFL